MSQKKISLADELNQASQIPTTHTLSEGHSRDSKEWN